jgi:hypothetical protein
MAFSFVLRDTSKPCALSSFTYLQGACLVVLWVVKSSAIGIFFPFFIALCVPVRIFISRYFHPEHLDNMDDYDHGQRKDF